MRRLLSLLLLPLLLFSAGLAQQKIPPAQLKIDVKITNTAGSEIYLMKVRPLKLFAWQGEPVRGYAEVLNNTEAACVLTVQAWVTNDIDRQGKPQAKNITLAPFTKQQVDFTWPAAAIQPYGHAMVVEVLKDGKVIAHGEDFFGTADNVWAIGIAGGHPVGFTADHVKDMAGIENAVEVFRSKYTNTFEKFFWAPDDFAEMTPDKDRWFSGQARYHEQMDRFKHLVAYGNEVGVLPTTYGKSIGSGSAARDIIREHPELINGYGGVMAFAPDTEELAKWDEEKEPYWQATAWAYYNMNDPAVVQKGIDEIINSTKQFGWAGVRFDGHFQARTGKQRVGDQTIDFTADMADKQTAANQRALKEQMAKVNPRFVYGYNYAECLLAGRLETQPRETIELCADGGHIMDEYAKHNASGSHPLNRWTVYAESIVKSAEQARRLGGHLFPMVNSNGPLGRYQTIFCFAAGAHPNSTPWSIDHPYNAFATRFSSLLWHKDLKNVWNPNGLVMVRSSVLWENYVREQQIDAKHKRLVIHLINPPAQETAFDSVAAVNELTRREQRRKAIADDAAKKKVTPDFTELDQLPPVKLYPDPQKDITVRIVPRALDGNWKATRVLLFDPETTTYQTLPLDTSDPYFWQLTVPELKFWALVVLELEQK